MSHYSVLIIGKHPEVQLFPYEQLDLPSELLRDDPRAEFVTEVPAGEFDRKARQIIAEIESDKPELAAYYRRLLTENRVEDVLESWFGGEISDVGDWGYYRNPEAKWDYFAFGGRWAGKLVLKPRRSGTVSPESLVGSSRPSPLEVDQACFGDVDWRKTRKAFKPFAVLKHGEWHEQGQMGWFGIARKYKPEQVWEDEISRLLEGIPQDEIVSIYDCHI